MMTFRAVLVRGLMALALAAGVIGSTGCVSNAYLRQRGIEALSLGDVDKAKHNFDRAVAQHPTDWKAQYFTGLIHLRQGRPLDAQLALEKSLTLRPRDPEWTPSIIDLLAESLHQLDRTENLYALLERAGSDYGTMHDFLREAGYKAKLGDSDGAKTAFRKAARFADPTDATPYLKMAEFFESIGDTDSTVLVLRQAYTIIPDSPRVQDKLRSYGVVPGPTIALPAER